MDSTVTLSLDRFHSYRSFGLDDPFDSFIGTLVLVCCESTASVVFALAI
jgi:hypothetical protein